MKKNIFAVTVFTTMIVLVFTLCGNTQAKVRMSRKNLTIEVSKTHTLKLKGVKGKVAWKSSKPGVAKVNKKGKVTALRKGKTTITARAGKKRYKCIVAVEDKKNTEVLNMATAKPNEPTAMPDNVAAGLGQPTSGPDKSTAKPEQPTSTPDLSTQKPSEPTPAPTPDYSDSDDEYCGPAVQEYAAYMDCIISDIGEEFIEISDADGGVICRYIKHEPYSESEISKYYFFPPEPEPGSGSLEVVYDGELTEWDTGIPLNSYDKVGSYAVKGDKINYSDIRIGDVVDVVYEYTLQVSPNNRKYGCCGINVHKR